MRIMLIGDIVQYCSDPALGSFLAIIKQIFFMMLVITPVLLILSLFVLGFRKVRNPDDKKIKGNIQNAVTAAIVVIFLEVFNVYLEIKKYHWFMLVSFVATLIVYILTILLLNEYKTSLINHVVTGKIDVRGEEI